VKITRRAFIGLGGAVTAAAAVALIRGESHQSGNVGNAVTTASPPPNGWGIPWGVGGWDIGLSPAPPLPDNDVFLPVVAK